MSGPATCLKRLIKDTRAQDLAEYGITLAVIGTAAIVAALAIEHNVGDHLWPQARRIIQRAANGPSGS